MLRHRTLTFDANDAVHNTASASRTAATALLRAKIGTGFPASFTSTALHLKETPDPRITTDSHGRIIEDDYATIRDNYETPKNPIILAHGLFGFDELHLVGAKIPGIRYWRGITDALAAKGIEVITATVSPSGSIEARAAKLGENIEMKAAGKSVNIIAHSMVLSLTTIASPHRGSAFADYMIEKIGPYQLPKVYKALEFFGLETGAFSQLTQKYMTENFNPKTPDREGVRYYSYGATVEPSLWSMFRQSHRIIEKLEGPNDGLVSVDSAKWGTYKGTLKDVSHLDLINWTNRLRWYVWELTGNKRNFNAIAFYLDIVDMLAKEGL
ncbi:hypothetical protein B0A49_02643 [Cryomyces minteri]|uniref:DUF676 domain-containing protein n=1 Tax=Cryomyces minteri TaxID=331657 RepID=A0A4V5NI36_9PEZI|nr:hypothetical protein B0A49_02643 [Cryomyces minteri]